MMEKMEDFKGDPQKRARDGKRLQPVSSVHTQSEAHVYEEEKKS